MLHQNYCVLAMSNTYPTALLLTDKRCVVVDGGAVARRKVSGLPEAGAAVTVVAPKMTEELQRMAARGKIGIKVQEATVTDIRQAFLASADDPTVNEQIGHAALEAGQPVNVANYPELCNSFVPATIRYPPRADEHCRFNGWYQPYAGTSLTSAVGWVCLGLSMRAS